MAEPTYSPRLRTGVVLCGTGTAGAYHAELEAAVDRTGSALLLPDAATTAALTEWKTAKEVTVDIRAKSGPIHGIVPLDGLSLALQTLTAHCPPR